MSSQSEQWYRDHVAYHDSQGNSIETDSNAIVSTGNDNGAYVQAWVWVPDPESPEKS